MDVNCTYVCVSCVKQEKIINCISPSDIYNTSYDVSKIDRSREEGLNTS